MTQTEFWFVIRELRYQEYLRITGHRVKAPTYSMDDVKPWKVIDLKGFEYQPILEHNSIKDMFSGTI